MSVARYVALTRLQFTAAEIAALEQKTPRAVHRGLARAGVKPYRPPGSDRRPRQIQLHESMIDTRTQGTRP